MDKKSNYFFGKIFSALIPQHLWKMELSWTVSFTIILFFLGFWGSDVVSVFINFCFQNTRQAIDAYSVCQIIYLFICAYCIYVIWKKGDTRICRGLSLPLLIYITMVFITMNVIYCQKIIDDTSVSWFYFIVVFRYSLIFVISILAFSCSVFDDHIKPIFYTIFLTLILYNLLILGYFSKDIINGCIMRDWQFLIRFNEVFATPLKNMSIHSNFVSILGAILASYTFWAWGQRKINWVSAIFCYVLGIVILFFGASRNAFVSIILTHIIIIIFSDLKKRKRWIIFLLLCIGISYGIGCWFMVKTKPVGYQMVCADIFTRIHDTFKSKLYHRYIKVSISTSGGPTPVPSNSDIVKSPNIPSINKPSTVIVSDREIDQNDILNIHEEGRIIMLRGVISHVKKHPFFSMQREIQLKRGGKIVSTMPHSIVLDSFLISGIPGGILLLYVLFRAGLDAIYVLRKIPERGFLAIMFFFLLFSSFFEFQTGSGRGDWIFLTIVLLRTTILERNTNQT